MKTILFKFTPVATLLVLFAATPISANTPRGNTNNPGSELAPKFPRSFVPRVPGLRIDRQGNIILPPPFQQRFNQDLATLVRELRSSNQTGTTIADILQSPTGIYRYMEIIGELRAVVSQPAVPPTEPGVEPERPGFVRLDLKRQGSTPASIAERFSRYAANLNTQGGEFTIFGNDRQGVTRNIQVRLMPRLDRQMELRFTSNSAALKGADGQQITESFLVPNARVAAVLAGVLPALDAANASLPSMRMAAKIVTSLGNVNFTALEIQDLAQGLSESLIASEGLLAGCGKDTAVKACTDISVNRLAIAIRAYNEVVAKTKPQALVALANNPEFKTLGEVLRRARNAITQEAASR